MTNKLLIRARMEIDNMCDQVEINPSPLIEQVDRHLYHELGAREMINAYYHAGMNTKERMRYANTARQVICNLLMEHVDDLNLTDGEDE